MPEGDTIWKTAYTLRRALAGRRVDAVHATVPLRRRPERGTTVRDVEARGKHLLIRFDDGSVLHTHMRMRGSWHVFRSGEPWPARARAMRVAIEAGGVQAVCFSAPVVEILDERDLARHPSLGSLGPDLTAPDPDLAEASRRLGSCGAVEVGVALLDQRVVAGIGNVYKSEVLFACRVDPFVSVSVLDEPTRASIVATAARMLRSNAERPGPRSTTARGRTAVYGHAGRPCARCGTRIDARRQGEQARVTYWCPSCQRTPTTSRPM
jgi:endonuclease-8